MPICVHYIALYKTKFTEMVSSLLSDFSVSLNFRTPLSQNSYFGA